MYRERSGAKGSSWVDFVITILLIAAILGMTVIMGFLKSLPVPFNSICTVFFIVVLTMACFFLYRYRLSAFQYTVFYKDPEPGELDAYGNPMKEYAHKDGTLFFERMMNRKGRILEKIEPDEYIEIVKPGDAPTKLNPDELKLTVGMNMSVYPKKKCHTIYYHRKARTFRLYFSPSEELYTIIADFIAKRDADKAE